eukprot:407606-Rhodomonas_salina.1
MLCSVALRLVPRPNNNKNKNKNKNKNNKNKNNNKNQSFSPRTRSKIQDPRSKISPSPKGKKEKRLPAMHPAGKVEEVPGFEDALQERVGELGLSKVLGREAG